MLSLSLPPSVCVCCVCVCCVCVCVCVWTYSGGEFGAIMQVHIQNDGPVTLMLESPQFPPPKEVLT